MTSSIGDPWPREVIPSPGQPAQSQFTVFCGVFGSRWIDNVVRNLERQSTFPLNVLMAVNGRDNALVNRLIQVQRDSHHDILVVVNERNVGPAGSYERNRDLIQSPWTAFMHQDDVYLEGHMSVLTELAHRAPHDTVALFTTLGGVSEVGHRLSAPPPMENAHLRGRPPWVLVPEIIRRHPFPTPASAVRSSVHLAGMAWYDSGAPDSEAFARLACRGTILASDEVTVLYRQPNDSESSRTDWNTRAWLWSVSLERILSSDEFEDLLRDIPREHRTEFALALLEAIPARYPTSGIFVYLQFIAAQRMSAAWEYREPASLQFLQGTLAAWGSSAAVATLQSLSGATAPPIRSSGASLLGATPPLARMDRRVRAIYGRVAPLLPPRANASMIRVYRRIRRGAS